ncbi:hypothetical protein [Fictibacillus sp. KU28468]|uniref:hypothetical protein n=1 Tax=Fictibacillus sp. KU28468 TaxID=2991053 RepID=UPI00223DAC74|nr:hypothetical protein [Fictibacillus sp. KU28468]UZJ77350.1 hypothetical protein OKX00_14300 [Fictibacillus sp. KU28468]
MGSLFKKQGCGCNEESSSSSSSFVHKKRKKHESSSSSSSSSFVRRRKRKEESSSSSSSSSSHNQCKGCACEQIKKLRPGASVQIVLKGGEDFFDGEITFACFDHKTCCATFILDGYPIIIDCRQIVAIQLFT